MSDRVYYTNQILENCAQMFPGHNPRMLTVNEGGSCKIFIVSSTSGELLLESTGTWPRDYSSFLSRTENMLSAHVAKIRAGRGTVREEKKVDVAAIIQEMEELKREMRATKSENEKLQGELGGWKNGVADWKREVEEWKKENEGLRRQLAVVEASRDYRPSTNAVESDCGEGLDTPGGTERFDSEAGFGDEK
jgi:hypothetical protein